jgi:hypothetical protein
VPHLAELWDMRIARGVMKLAWTRGGRGVQSGDEDAGAWSGVFERRSEWCRE